MATGPRAGFWSATWLRALVLVCVGVATYWNGLGHPFVLDDRVAIVENEQVRDWTDAGRVLSPRRDSPVAGRPLVNATLAVNYSMAGLEPRANRATNLAIHVLCALLLMAAVRRTLAAAARWTLPEASAATSSWGAC